MENNNVTNDQLAGMIQRGFSETAKKADMDRRFDIVEKDIKEIKEILIQKNTERIEN